jgi:hypothetical protein
MKHPAIAGIARITSGVKRFTQLGQGDEISFGYDRNIDFADFDLNILIVDLNAVETQFLVGVVNKAVNRFGSTCRRLVNDGVAQRLNANLVEIVSERVEQPLRH